MRQFDDQVIHDLEFDLVRAMLHDFCSQPTARLRALELLPVLDHHKLHRTLFQVHEFTSIRRDGVAFPAIDFSEVEDEIRMLQAKESVLNEESFYRIYRANALVNEIIKAFEGMEEVFPHLFNIISNIEYSEEMMQAIITVFDNKWKVKDDASPELKQIRSSIVEVRRSISKNFTRVMKEYAGKGFLGDTGESFLNERRVLAVYSTHKRKVPGIVISSSKTGALTYIEPEVNIQLNFELESLMDDERTEIRKILRQLTQQIRHQLPLIRNHQRCLTEFDFIQAKARLAMDIDAILPEISDEPMIDLKLAYHPLLLLSNRRNHKKTFPQSLRMDRDQRMLVISGPNAGGKSITMKTVGLLQVMLQCGLLVPVAPGSKMAFFHSVLTDIGDNQSIENQLSTYSYRLKRMKLFLDSANRRSLVLLDEFGTGSDPDLGGALAEVFFEELYGRKTFGVITTHYGNIKLKAAQMKHAVNGCMLFNTETLEPTYQLSIGQPGSSFTFEVALINGIPASMIESAKKKLSKQKVQMDEMLASLQDEKTKYEQFTQNAREAGELASNAIQEYEKKRERMEERLQKQQDTIERNNKYLNHGKRMVQFIESYNLRSKNKELLDEVKKYIAMEKTKIDEERKKRSLTKKAKKTQEETERKVKRTEAIKVGSLVRLENTKQTGTVLEMDKGQATVAIGVFKTKVDVKKLEFVM
ncbi:MAG: DNA mismatch repair protein MutS [Flavobacteriales bacterium]|nr:DNA mismatch repair protein MutS [Flavobacteriales bacterium]